MASPPRVKRARSCHALGGLAVVCLALVLAGATRCAADSGTGTTPQGGAPPTLGSAVAHGSVGGDDRGAGVLANEARVGERLSVLRRAFALHYGSHNSAPDAAMAMQAYQHVVDTAHRNDTMTGAALAGMGLLLETGGGLHGNLQADIPRALRLFEAAAALGNATAQFAVGVAQSLGAWGFPRDEATAILNMYFAALGGDTQAQLAMGYRYYRGIGVPKRCHSAATYYELAANAAVDATALQGSQTLNIRKRLNVKHLDGFRATTAESRDEELLNYYTHTAENGDVSAQVALGQIHYFGAKGVERNMTTAFKWFSAAAEAGDHSAQADLAHLYLHGLGVEQDNSSALVLFTAAAEAGVASAINGLGYIHLNGAGVPESPPRALQHFKRAADGNNMDALYNLGVMSLTGKGVPREFTQALKYFTRAANQGHLQAGHKLGQMHMHGIGTQRSCQRAVKLFLQVASRGPLVKQLDDAYKLLVAGRAEESFWLYAKAAEQGFDVAQWNAAFLLDRELATGNIGLTPPASAAGHATDPPSTGHATFTREPVDVSRDGEAGAAEEEFSDEDGDNGIVGGEAADDDDSAAPTGAHNSPGASTPDGAPAGDAGREATAVSERSSASFSAVSAREAQALRLFTLCSQQGFVEANLVVGDYHYYGRAGMSPDPHAAAHHYHIAADMNNPQAMFNLGYMHEHGLGVKSDPHLAKRFYDMSVETNAKSYFAVKLALYKMYLAAWWQRTTALVAAWFGLGEPIIDGSDAGASGVPEPAAQPPQAGNSDARHPPEEPAAVRAAKARTGNDKARRRGAAKQALRRVWDTLERVFGDTYGAVAAVAGSVMLALSQDPSAASGEDTVALAFLAGLLFTVLGLIVWRAPRGA